jgi:hypothetical protein
MRVLRMGTVPGDWYQDNLLGRIYLMNDPRVLIIFSAVFSLLGLYNIYQGLKRIREVQARGQTLAWYKQINLLTGIEFCLLALVFLTSISIREKILPGSLSRIITPFYLVVLLITAVMAGLVIRQSFSNARRARGQTSVQITQSNRADDANKNTDGELVPEERTANLQRRRERRRNAAAARRRRSGKA